MLHGRYLLLLTYAITMITLPTSAMIESEDLRLQLENYNTRASLLYEQAFFLELLSSIIETRRYDELNADIALARSKIMARVVSSIEQHELPFGEEVPPHEIFSLSNIYYVCLYLVYQKTFRKLLDELPYLAQIPEANLLAHMLALLSVFSKLRTINLSSTLSYLNAHLPQFVDLIQYYKKPRAYSSLRTSYTEYVRLLREQTIFYGSMTQYVFHRYINPERKLLPLFLDSNIEPVLHSPSTPRDATPTYECSHGTDSPQPTKKRKSEDSTESPFQFVTHSSLKQCELFAAYDYQEYLSTHVARVLEKPDELPLFLEDFFRSYHKNHNTLQSAFTHITQQPDRCIPNSLVPLQTTCDILHRMKEEPSSTQQFLCTLKAMLEEHYQERTTC